MFRPEGGSIQKGVYVKRSVLDPKHDTYTCWVARQYARSQVAAAKINEDMAL